MTMHDDGLTLANAQQLIASAINEAVRREVPVAVAVTDFGGRVVAFARMDGVSYVVGETAAPKAVAAGAFGAPTHVLVAGMAQNLAMAANFALAAARNPEMLVVPGDLPVMHGGRCIGGLGVSGGRGDDDQVIGTAALMTSAL